MTAVSVNYLFHLVDAMDHVRGTPLEHTQDVLLVLFSECRI